MVKYFSENGDSCCFVNILVQRDPHSGILETGVLDTETVIDWLGYSASEMEFLSSPKPFCGALEQALQEWNF